MNKELTKDPAKVVLDLNLNDWASLERYAALFDIKSRRGTKSVTRDFINFKIAAFATNSQMALVQCPGARKRLRNYYTIPAKHKEVFRQLACLHSTNVSAVVFRYVILPILASRHQIVQQGYSSSST